MSFFCNTKRLCWSCYKCEYIWETSKEQKLPTFCPVCDSRKIRGIDPKSFDDWKEIYKYSDEYIEINYPNIKNNVVFQHYLWKGSFDCCKWAGYLKEYLIRKEAANIAD